MQYLFIFALFCLSMSLSKCHIGNRHNFKDYIYRTEFPNFPNLENGFFTFPTFFRFLNTVDTLNLLLNFLLLCVTCSSTTQHLPYFLVSESKEDYHPTDPKQHEMSLWPLGNCAARLKIVVLQLFSPTLIKNYRLHVELLAWQKEKIHKKVSLPVIIIMIYWTAVQIYRIVTIHSHK